ncbi:hypothetical protein HGO97_012465 [Faecalicatena sp. AGMB00832]|uniref:PilX-like prepilin protein n=1 Tax=Faecalicatena faecalis TaxID=2726362 RepID=A0ABS6D4U9_9FIRM|nr:hypothetical protein [Faecalicatena faecalis]MBU3876617.1 hypothetical protein [Faecalicatena faecalis]
MESKKKSAPFVNIGSSSLLVIFLVLCLVTFATLSLSSAQSDYKFSKRLADRRTAYYTAANEAEEILDAIDAVLTESYKSSQSTYYHEVQRRLSDFTFENAKQGGNSTELELDFSTDSPTVAYTVPISEKQALSVILTLVPGKNADEGLYKIREWKVVSTKEWSGDDTLNLIQ